MKKDKFEMKRTAFNKQDIIKTMTYVDALQQGLVDYDDIDDFIDEWHNGNSTLEIDEFLGMTEEQYFNWIDNGYKSLKEMFKRVNSK